MNDRKVPLYATTAPVVTSRKKGCAHYRARAREAIFNNDLREAITYFRHELEAADMTESIKAVELELFVRAIDEQVKLIREHFFYMHLDVYLDTVEMARRNIRCNGYRTRMVKVTQDNFELVTAFIYMAGDCRGKLMELHANGPITDDALADIEERLPAW